MNYHDIKHLSLSTTSEDEQLSLAENCKMAFWLCQNPNLHISVQRLLSQNYKHFLMRNDKIHPNLRYAIEKFYETLNDDGKLRTKYGSYKHNCMKYVKREDQFSLTYYDFCELLRAKGYKSSDLKGIKFERKHIYDKKRDVYYRTIFYNFNTLRLVKKVKDKPLDKSAAFIDEEVILTDEQMENYEEPFFYDQDWR